MATLNDAVRVHIAAIMPILHDMTELKAYLDSHDISEPKAKNDDGYKNRLVCPKWWKRTLDRKQSRETEAKQIEAGKVHSRGQKYASDYAVVKGVQRAHSGQEFVKTYAMISDADDIVEMSDIVTGSLSNPINRRAELMIRMAGFEAYAMANGYVGEFLTITCPSKFHRFSQGEFNPAYDPEEISPKAAQKYLCSIWAKMRAQMARDNVRVFGFRVAEPHHDGCPHWHMLLFVEQSKVEQLRAIMQGYALEMDGDEPGAEKYRFKSVSIDPNQGTATGYIAKYISKNLGFSIEPETIGEPDQTDYGRRVKAWASIWGIRQFQQIGGVPVSIWRELRKLSEVIDDPVIETARLAADESRWADFLEIMGGATVTREEMAIHLKKNTLFDMRTGEIKQNRYGEILTVIMGLFSVCKDVTTKLKFWQLVPVSRLAAKGSDRAALAAGGFPTWSPVNNCTQYRTQAA